MRLKFWGTAGSFGLYNPERARFGCNTLCLEIRSDCLPPGQHLYVDSGTGIIAASREFLRLEGRAVVILQTHHHLDHILGFPGSMFPYLKDVAVTFVGPGEYKGSREALATIMNPPLFPVPFAEVASHIDQHVVDLPSTEVIAFHPVRGMTILTIEDYERRLQRGGGVAFDTGAVPASQCLIVRMTRTNHPEKTIGYRFEEGSSGRVLTTLFDHENVDSVSQALRDHVRDADLLVEDCQYDMKVYCGERGSWGARRSRRGPAHRRGRTGARGGPDPSRPVRGRQGHRGPRRGMPHLRSPGDAEDPDLRRRRLPRSGSRRPEDLSELASEGRVLSPGPAPGARICAWKPARRREPQRADQPRAPRHGMLRAGSGARGHPPRAFMSSGKPPSDGLGKLSALSGATGCRTANGWSSRPSPGFARASEGGQAGGSSETPLKL